MINPNRAPGRKYLPAQHTGQEPIDVPAIRLVDSSFHEKPILLPSSQAAENRLKMMDSAILIFGLAAMIGVIQALTGVLVNEVFLLSGNLVAACGLSLWCHYFDLTDGRYSLGKSVLIGFGLLLLNIVGFLATMGLISVGNILVLTMGFGLLSLISAFVHYEVSRPFFQSKPESVYYRLEHAIKRAFDCTSALLGLIALSPLLLLVLALLRLESSGSPLFEQKRVGRGETIFKMFKFRSMVQHAEALFQPKSTTLFKRQDDPRITRLGQIIRKLSVDELPQLWNVVCGEMSLVGPRPPLPSEYELMNRYHCRKFEVTPGLTGLWQIIGRVNNQRDFNSVAAYDVYYIENWCLLEDFKILLKTIPVVLLQKGAC